MARLTLLASAVIYASVLPNGDGPSLGCVSAEEPAVLTISVNPEMGDWWIGDCTGDNKSTEWSGGYSRYLWNLPATFDTHELQGPCEVRAYRQDGPLRVRSAPIVISPGETGGRVLTLPSHRTAGIGFSFGVEAAGVRVREVHANTPADGRLQTGDVITAVDGVSIAGMTSWQFVEHSLGPAETEVTLTVARTGDQRFLRQEYWR